MAKKPDIQLVGGGVLAASGFRTAGFYCGIKRDATKLDLGLLIADEPATAAVTLTTNRVKAAPVKWCRKLVESRTQFRGLVVNSGNANACTGPKGEADTAATAAAVASLLGCQPEEVFVCSTGVIGEYMPMEKLAGGMPQVFKALENSPVAADRFANAILTTDTRPKTASVRVFCSGGSFHVGGCCKGAGMIGPKMATMLAFLTTDAVVGAPILRAALSKAVGQSFNSITVDGHTSTNDTALLLASGKSGVRIESAAARSCFQQALNQVTLDLAKAIIRDGEGATKLVQIEVTGAESSAAARTIANTMARSPLNLTAIHGGDPNWGRFISSAGYAGPNFVEEKARLFINGQPVFHLGRPADTTEAILTNEMKKAELHLLLDVGLGRGKATVWACDLSKEYVTINADYHT